MMLYSSQARHQVKCTGFTLVETLIAFLVFGMVISGVLYGYVQINRMAEWSSMSLAAQSAASVTASGSETPESRRMASMVEKSRCMRFRRHGNR